MTATLRSRLGGLAGGRMRRAVLVLAGGTALAQLIVLLSTPIISRLYTPAEFGAAAGLLALVVLLTPIAGLTYDHAIPIPRERDAVTNLILLCILITLFVAVGLAVVFLVAGEQVVNLFSGGALESSLWLLVVALIGAGLTSAVTGWAIREREFGAISNSRVSQSIALVATQLGAGFAGAGGGGLVLGDAVGRVTAFLQLQRRLRSARRRTPSVPTPEKLFEVARRYKHFPLVGTWPNLIQGVVLQAPLLLLIGLYGAAEGGQFALAQRLIAAPVVLIVLSVSQVFIAEASAQLQRDPAGLRPLFSHSLRRLARSGVPFLPLLSFAGIILVPVVFGEPWRDAGLYIAALSPMYVAQLITSPFGGILDVLERQDLLLVREAARIVLMAGAVIVADALGFSALTAVIMVGIAGAVSYAIYGGISWYAVRRA